MLRSGSIRLVAVLLGSVTLLAGCDRAHTPQAAASQVSDSSGDVVLQTSAPGQMDSVSTSADRGRIRGDAAAAVWLVEVSDFQCPYCKAWHDQVFDTIDREYVKTGKVRLAYLNFPLDRIHANARSAAEAAMCASVQGKFWELHDALFDTQVRWAESKTPMTLYDSLATAAGVNHQAWRTCMTSHATMKLIDADLKRSSDAGVQSTPTFFVGDRAIVGALPVDSFRVALDLAIAKAKAPR